MGLTPWTLAFSMKAEVAKRIRTHCGSLVSLQRTESGTFLNCLRFQQVFFSKRKFTEIIFVPWAAVLAAG